MLNFSDYAVKTTKASNATCILESHPGFHVDVRRWTNSQAWSRTVRLEKSEYASKSEKTKNRNLHT
jgi:hypothetical protein